MRNMKNRNSNKMWVSILAPIAVSAAVYGLRKYMNGKLLRPVQNMMNKATSGGMANMSMGSALAEFSKELMPGTMKTGKSQNTSK
ncbi:hypothetical protein [Bacillus sp. FJAT-50079]|uniref:hypothetical protein n=1 Tax=Bacillus sp. FJAT-50079 TaxID=2833577 RepID=UPI001BC9899C|nr:hypothetical protein [Bacillus sp. FJAT-50079]MBS4209913.1 hypothetical protein [Bacillus sp. FJAT-50079]